jgi:shikimate dehydrogenase
VQILGAGGSARAAAWALREAGASEVSVWNRTAERARALAHDLGVRAVSDPQRAEVLINCTSVGLERSAGEPDTLAQLGLSVDLLDGYAYVVDMVYRADGPTRLLAIAAERGVRTLDGLEVLLAQGAVSFELWTGRTAPLQAMRGALRDASAA